MEAEAVRQRCSEVSERKSVDDRVGLEEELKPREKGLRPKLRDWSCGRRRLRSCFERIMLSKRVIAACVGVMVDADVAIGTGRVCSRSAMNSLKAMILLN